jgi:hypothetical protein
LPWSTWAMMAILKMGLTAIAVELLTAFMSCLGA